jgi:hypothetical protein
MHHMLSLERQKSLESRIQFNKPFKCVEIRMNSASDVIPSLSRDKPHVIWLDYDGVLHKDFLSDIQSALTVLSPGSIVLVTVDVEPPEDVDYKLINPDFDTAKEVMGPKQWKQYFEFHASTYLRLGVTEEDFGKAELRARTAEILKACFTRAIVSRPDLDFAPMFNFLYRDSHWMLSMGGMIVGKAERRQLRASTLSEAGFYRDTFDSPPFEIRVPRLTRKERVFLDREMPCPNGWSPADFEMEPQEVQQYREIYRFLPAFAEILV